MPSKNVTGSLGSGELTPVEWKQSLSKIKEMTETAVAFANTAGRCIFVGVSLQGKVLGVW